MATWSNSVRAGLFRNDQVGVENDPYAASVNPRTGLNPAADSGQNALQPGLVDQATTGMSVPMSVSAYEMMPMTQPQGGVPDELTQQPQQPQQPQIRLGYDPEQGAFLVNNQVIDEQDVLSLREVPSFVQEPPSEAPPPGNWRPTDLQSIKSWKDELETLTTGERLRVGTQNVVGGSVRGIGRGLEMAGAEGVGEAVISAGDTLSADEFTQDRMAVEREANSLWRNMLNAPVEGLPSFGTIVTGSIAGGMIAGPKGAAVGGILAAFPMILDSTYQSAEQQQGEEFVNSPEGKTEVLSIALGNTIMQTFGANVATRALTPALKDIIEGSARSVIQSQRQSVARGAAAGTIAEGTAEALGIVIEQAAFNPTVREALSEGEVQGLLPYIADEYGEDAAIAFAGGAVLGGGVAGAGTALSNARISDGPLTNEQDMTGEDGTPPPSPTTPDAPVISEQLDLPLQGGELPTQPTEFAPTEPGTQGVLNIAQPGEQISAEEVAARGMPLQTQDGSPIQTQPEQLDLLSGATPQQGALQFAPPAPEGRRFGTAPDPVPQTQMGEQMAQAQRERELQMAEQQRLEQEDVQREQEFNRAIAQREQEAADQQAAQQQIEQEVADQQERRARARELLQRGRAQTQETAAPEQQQLLSPREAPRPSRGELLRRGVAAVPETQPQPVVPEPVQPGLFDEPTQPDLPGIPSQVTPEIAGERWEEGRSSGVRRWDNLSPERQEQWRQAIERREATPAAQRQISRAESAQRLTPRSQRQAAQETTDAVQERSPETVDAQEQARDGEAVGTRDAEEQGTTPARQVEEVTEDQVQVQVTEPEAEVTQVTEPEVETTPATEPETATTPEPETAPATQVEAAEASESQLVQMDVDAGVPTTFLMDAAFGADVSKAARKTARDFLDSYVETNGKDDAYISALQGYAAAESYVSSISKTSNLYKMLNEAGLLAWASRKGVVVDVDPVNKPDSQAHRFDDDPVADGRDTHAARLANEINQFTANDTPLNNQQKTALKKKLEGLWKKTKTEGNTNAVLNDIGTPLSAYFTSSGKLKTNPITGRPSTREIDQRQAQAEQQLARDDAQRAAQEEAIQMDEIRRLEQAERLGRRDISDDFAGFGLSDEVGDGGWRRVDNNKPITRPLPTGRAKLIISQFRSRLRVKPTIKLYKNQADLRSKNPDLYAKAKAARGTRDDFDTTVAAGYSFGGNQVIIFTDRIPTEQALRFVLAHETLGHLGFRAIVDSTTLDKALDKIYNTDTRAQQYVDAAMANRNMSKREATEEYLADMAGSLDVSYLARFWNAVKNAVERATGLELGDSSARYLISQARKYVRNGTVDGVPVRFTQIARDMQAIESGLDPHNSGHFKSVSEYAQDTIAATGLMKNNTGLPMTTEEFSAWAKGLPKDTFNSWEKFRKNVFSLTTFKAMENEGLAELHGTINQGKNKTQSVKVNMNEIMKPVLDRGFGFSNNETAMGGISKRQYDRVNELLYSAMFRAINKYDENTAKGPNLYTVKEDGSLELNPAEVERLEKFGSISFEEARDGFSWTETLPLEEGATEAETVTRRFAGIKGLKKDSLEWIGFERSREVVNKTALQTLKARYSAHNGDIKLAFKEMELFMQDDQFRPNERRFLERVARRYQEVYTKDQILDDTGTPQLNPESIQSAEEFIAAINSALIADGTDRNQVAAELMSGKPEETIRNIEAIKARRKNVVDKERPNRVVEENRFLLQNTIKQLVGNAISNENGDRSAKQTLGTGFVPLVRRGSWQTRIVAKDKQGNIVRLQREYKDMSIYSQFDSESEAAAFSNEINQQAFSNVEGEAKPTYRLKAYNNEKNSYEFMDVTIEAVPEKALNAAAAPPELNLNEFVRGLRQFGVVLPPSKLEPIIIAMTAQNNRARKRLLQRSGTPGFDPDAVRAITEYVETQAALIGKLHMRPKVAELMNLNLPSTQRKWFGDDAKLQKLKDRWEQTSQDPSANEQAKRNARVEYDRYSYMHKNTKPEGRADRGNLYFNEGAQLVSFLDNNAQTDTSDFETGKIVSNLRGYTSMMQLGASVATAALNYFGAVVNGIPYLATYNEKNAYGGGFGFGKSTVEFTKALHHLGIRAAVLSKNQLNRAEYYDKIANSKELQDKYDLKPHEARFIALEIREGRMIPAQSNALLGVARGKKMTGVFRRFIDGWMYTFNSSEQATRRALGLAGYRMEYERQIAAGVSEANAIETARNFAVNMLDQTVGDYSVVNRPPAWRGPIGSFVYMYKTFPTTSIQSLSRLSRTGQAQMLGMLLLLSGVRGLPFAEDIEDIVDTIAAKLGLPMASVRLELAKLVDGLLPGSSMVVINGLLNQITEGDVGVRTSLGDIAPGTSALLPGANVSREVGSIAGPAANMLLGVGKSAGDVLSAVRNPSVTSVNDVVRGSPVTMLRAFGDAYTYQDNGAIVDRQGYVVSPDVTARTMISRMLGFYPRAASAQYDAIRIAQRVSNYQREVSASFRTAAVKATMQNDRARLRAVYNTVAEWNKVNANTGLRIDDFQDKVRRAVREARRPGIERYLRTTPLSARAQANVAVDLLGY